MTPPVRAARSAGPRAASVSYRREVVTLTAMLTSPHWRAFAMSRSPAEISGFVVIAGQSVVMEHQLRAALATRFGGPPPAPIPAFGLGRPFALGKQNAALVLRHKGGGAPDLPAALVREFETAGRVIGEYMMLRGPAPEDLPTLRALGYQPEEIAKAEEARVNRRKRLAAMLKDGTVDRGQRGDFVHAG